MTKLVDLCEDETGWFMWRRFDNKTDLCEEGSKLVDL